MNPHPRDRRFSDWLNANFKHWSLLPAVVVFVVLTIYPIANLLRMSVSTIEFRDGSEIWSFTPGRNWEALLTRPGARSDRCEHARVRRASPSSPRWCSASDSHLLVGA